MEITMTNEEIRQQVLTHQAAIQVCLEECCGKFELNPKIAEHKRGIDELRKQCTHLNSNNETYTFNGYCYYCGKRMR